MSLKEMRESLSSTMAEAQSLNAVAKAESRDLTGDESAQIDTLLDNADKIRDAIVKANASADRLARLDAAVAETYTTNGRKTSPNTATINANSQVTVKERFEDDPKKGFKKPSDFIMAVMDAGRNPHAVTDNRLKFLATAGSDEQGTYSDPYGGFLVPEAFSPNMLRLDPEADILSGRTLTIPMATAVVKIPARVDKNHSTSVSGGLTVTRKAETVAGTASRMQMEEIRFEAAKLTGLSYVTEELLTDSPISFAALLAQGFADEFAAKLIDERINGSGAGEYLGVLGSPCLLTIAKETNQNADTIAYINLIKMRARCWGYGKAVWLANQDCLPQLAQLNQAVGTAGTIVWQPSAREDVPDMLFGRPLIFTEYAKTVGDLGDIILGNWSQYLEGTYQPLQSAESVHVRFENHERTFKFWTRNAGAPWWNTYLTPKNSTSTLSPFVVLAAR